MTQAVSLGSARQAFLAMLARDIYVTSREIGAYLAQDLIQPFFFLFIFVRVLGSAGVVSNDYGQTMLPGLLALISFFGALQAVAFRLVLEFEWTLEIEDRLLAPLSLPLVAMEKVVFGACRGVLSSLLMVPIGLIVLSGVSWPLSGLAPALFSMALGGLIGGAVGLVFGTIVPPRRVTIVFSVLVAPLLFTGSVQFPWYSLTGERWFQVLCALNPLTYISEGIRASLVPSIAHIPYWLCTIVSLAGIAGFGRLGIHGFLRRALR
ncbi:MAG: ABC transporter permease [Pseudonocardia sp.]|nr:ABC transporter permease [Pseudonocardia sp.]